MNTSFAKQARVRHSHQTGTSPNAIAVAEGLDLSVVLSILGLKRVKEMSEERRLLMAVPTLTEQEALEAKE